MGIKLNAMLEDNQQLALVTQHYAVGMHLYTSIEDTNSMVYPATLLISSPWRECQPTRISLGWLLFRCCCFFPKKILMQVFFSSKTPPLHWTVYDSSWNTLICLFPFLGLTRRGQLKQLTKLYTCHIVQWRTSLRPQSCFSLSHMPGHPFGDERWMEKQLRNISILGWL